MPVSSRVPEAQRYLNAARALANHAIAGAEWGRWGNTALALQGLHSRVLAAKAADPALDVADALRAATLTSGVFAGLLSETVSGYRIEHGERDQFDLAQGQIDAARLARDVGTRLNGLAGAWFEARDGVSPMAIENRRDFEASGAVLSRVLTDMDAYLERGPEAGRAEVAAARTEIAGVAALIARVVSDGEDSLGSGEHLDLLLALTNTAEDLKAAQSESAWVRNWQWGLTQVVYVYADRALENAAGFLSPFHPVYVLGARAMDQARTDRANRRADDFMDGIIGQRCTVLGIYNLVYRPIRDIPNACCEPMREMRELDPDIPIPRRCGNHAPVLRTPPDQSSLTRAEVRLTLTATDENRDRLVYSAENLPPGLEIDREGGFIHGTITSNLNSPYTVTVRASDVWASAEKTFLWRVERGLRSTLSKHITRHVINVEHPIGPAFKSWCTFEGCSMSPRIYHDHLPDGRLGVAYSGRDGHGYFLRIRGSIVEQVLRFDRRQVWGLGAHPDGSFGLMLRGVEEGRLTMFIRHHDPDGVAAWETALNSRHTLPQFEVGGNSLIGDGRLAAGGGRYAAYHTVKGVSGGYRGHHADQLRFHWSETGDRAGGGWDWGCSHSMASLVRWHPQHRRFIALCASDMYPARGIVAWRSHLLFAAGGSGNGLVSSQLGQVAPTRQGWLLAFNAVNRPRSEAHGIGIRQMDVLGRPKGEVRWLTRTDGTCERDPSLARLGRDNEQERFLVGWRKQCRPRTWHLAVINARGDLLSTIQPAGAVWGRRDDSFRTAPNGDVTWIQMSGWNHLAFRMKVHRFSLDR